MKNKRREEAYGLGKNFLLKKKKKEFPPWLEVFIHLLDYYTKFC